MGLLLCVWGKEEQGLPGWAGGKCSHFPWLLSMSISHLTDEMRGNLVVFHAWPRKVHLTITAPIQHVQKLSLMVRVGL